jgi:hypothetical protein
MSEDRRSCATCKHWLSDQGEQYDWRVRIRLTLLPGESQEDRWEHDSPYEQRAARVERSYGLCKKIDLLDSYDEVSEDELPLAFTKDGSDYKANLYTRAEFGCAAHEPKENDGG